MNEKVYAAHLLLGILCLHHVPVRPKSYQLISNTEDWVVKFEGYVGDDVTIEFMPGIYEIQDDISITNVSNFSITGDSANASHVTFSCSSLSSWIITNSSFIEIGNITFLNCGNKYDAQFLEGAVSSKIKAAIFMYNVSSIKMVNVTMENSCGYGIIALNIIGMCTFEHITIHGNNILNTFCKRGHTIFGGMALLSLEAKDTKLLQQDTAINIKHCLFVNIQAIHDDETIRSIEYFNSSIINIVLYQVNYHIELNINYINITNITIAKESIISISYSKNSTNNVTIANSSIAYTTANYSTVKINYREDDTTLPKLQHTFCLTSCNFYYNVADYVLEMEHIYNGSMSMQLNNNVFENNTVGKIVFRTKEVVPLISGYLKFTRNNASVVFAMSDYVLMEEGSVLSFINNSVNSQNKVKVKNYLVKKDNRNSSHCPFQFINSTNVSIIFHANHGYSRAVRGNAMFGCAWIPSFPSRKKLLPNEVYNRTIYYSGTEIKGISGWENSVCSCNGNSRCGQNCLNVNSFYVYPGETISISFRHSYFNIAMYTDFAASTFDAIAPPCGIYPRNPSNPQIDLIFKQCTLLNYTIASNSSMCLLLLKTATKENTMYALRVHLKNCSQGFILDNANAICMCDLKLLKALKGLKCDITKKMFQPPPKSWLASEGSDIIFTKACYSNYCLKYTNLVEPSKPDSQCLPGRSGIACGKCAQGLSAMFGTTQCKKCTNYWLFLIPAFVVAGLLLVVASFVLNLTVVDGDINGYIFMISGLSIYSSTVLPSTRDAPWVIVALFNLDLGIEVCFYNGMTAYSATWLRLIFPIYVLLIVIIMAFVSRYIQIVEKITRKRVIPVIATLYLLSYCKIMQVTFRALFSYTKVYHLQSENMTLYWGIDSRIQLFGVEFLVLFIFCLIVFVFLIIPTNILLIAGKSAYRFKIVVTYLMPFLDAYQAPFKENCRHILGVELLLRAIGFAIISLDSNNTVAVYSAVMLVYTVYICQIMPFKRRFNSINYSLYLVYINAYVILFTRFKPYSNTSKAYEVFFNMIFYLSFTQFLGIVAIHIWKYILQYYTFFNNFEIIIRKRLNMYTSRNSFTAIDSMTSSESKYASYQEELLALDADV